MWLGWHKSEVPSLRPADGILIVLLALPLLARRTAPLLVLAAVYVLAGLSTVIVHANSQPPLTQLLVIMIAWYSVAAYTSRRRWAWRGYGGSNWSVRPTCQVSLQIRQHVEDQLRRSSDRDGRGDSDHLG